MKLTLITIVALLITFSSCRQTEKNAAADTNGADGTQAAQSSANSAKDPYNTSTINDATAEVIRKFMIEKHNDVSGEDRKFSFYEIDLNGDTNNEYFIHLLGKSFCGTGGCSFYLLNNDLTVHSYFTVTNPPIFRSSKVTNGWNDLILFGDTDKNGGAKNYIHLEVDNTTKKYPGSPSVINKTDVAPGGSDVVMWSEKFSVAKEFIY